MPSSGGDNGGAMRVLIIEDEVPLAEAVARGLRREGYEVECAHDGLSGLNSPARPVPTPSSSTSSCPR